MDNLKTLIELDSLTLLFKTYVLMTIKAFVILSLGWLISSWVSGVANTLMKQSPLEKTIRRSLHKFLSIILKGIVFIIVLSTFGIKMTVIAAILGGLSIALGLALKGNISNFSDGIILLVTRHFKAGDFIEGSGFSGTVERINIFTTELTTPNNQKIIVPNSKILSNTLTNFAANPTRRIELTIGLSYDDDIAKGAVVLKEAAQAVEGVLADPAVDVWLTEFADSSINYSLRAWCNRSDFLKVRHHLIIALKAACDQNNLTIPYPQQDVHLFQKES